MPVSTPSLVTRAALVATGTTAAALLTLLPAAPPAAPPTAAASRAVRQPAERPPAPRSGGAPSAALGPQRPPRPPRQAPVEARRRRQARRQPAVAAAAARGAARAMSIAMGKLGAPYRWGATGPSAFDCSGLVYWAYQPDRRLAAAHQPAPMSRVGTPVSKAALQPGDLVFFYRPVSHVGDLHRRRQESCTPARRASR